MSLPPSEIPQGAIRFNTDSQKLEFYAQGEWWNMVIDNVGIATGGDTTAGARGVYISGQAAPPTGDLSTIEYVNIASTGSREDFGNLSVTDGGGNQPMSDRTRAVFSGENGPSGPDIDYVTISSTGNATDWGANLNRNTQYGMGISNSTRGIQAGAFNTPDHTGMDFVTIQSTGTVTDFGDLGTGASHGASVMSPTRGIFMGGYYAPGGNVTDKMQMVTTASTGGSQDFGNLSSSCHNNAGACSATRGVIAFGGTPSNVNTMEYITMSTLGNSTNFGDMNQVTTHNGGGCCSPTRGLFMGGYSPGYQTYMSMINIPTQGNAVDWGNSLSSGRINVQGCSNAHGGL